ncbi:MAG: amidohydrolase [Pseudomonadota bacterium]
MRKIHRLPWFVVLAASLIACSPLQPGEPRGADLVLTNGRIWTVNPKQPWANTVAIRDGRIIYVGGSENAGLFAGTKTIDLGGRMVMPGMVDGHTHPGLVSLEQYELFSEAEDHETFMADLKEWANANPGEGWVRGCCWPVQAYVDGDKGPDRIHLDEVFPDRPLWLTSSSWHSYWLNSKALEALGVDQNTTDPRFPIAMFKRDDKERLTGWVKEGAGWQFFGDVFELNPELHREGMRAALNTLSEHGVVALYDGGNLEFSDTVYGFLKELEDAGELPLRYEGTYMISVPERRQHAVAEMKRFRETYGGERLQFNTVKLFMDGVDENRSGAHISPYDDDPDYVSNTMLSVEDLRDFLVELHEAKLDLHIHVIGDLATKNALDAVEAAKTQVGKDFYPRVSLAHLQSIHPSDRARFGELGVSANFTSWWHGDDGLDSANVGIGPEKAADTYSTMSLLNTGANVTFSSDDWRLEVLTPFLGIEVGHTRRYPGAIAGVENPTMRGPAEERVPLELMVKGWTQNGAYQLRMEDNIGSIAVGKSADLLVLPQNLFEMDTQSIHSTKPDAVIVEGVLIHGEL